MSGPADRGVLAGAVLTIDLGAIAANYRLLAARAAPAVCAAVVKADAYGLGADQVAPALAAAGCRVFYVAHAEEGVALRAALRAAPGREPDVAVLHGPMPGSPDIFVEHRLLPVLSAPWQVAAWAELASRRGRALPAILQVDSGMTRFGLSEAEVDGLGRDGLAGIEVVQVMSHLACADEPENPANAAQLAAFTRLRTRLPAAPASLAASSGIFLGTGYHYDLVRPGAALYGVAPQPGRPNPMRPVVRLQGRIVQLREAPAGTPVGYGWTARTAAPARLATVGIGYADGLLRSLSGHGAAWRDGVRLPLVGRVSMDSIVIDVTALPPGAVEPGAFVDLLGPDQGVDTLAAAAGTIGYEILTSLGGRFHRIYRSSEADDAIRA